MASSPTYLQFANGANSLWIGQNVRELAAVFETGPADSRAFGPALAGQAGPVI